MNQALAAAETLPGVNGTKEMVLSALDDLISKTRDIAALEAELSRQNDESGAVSTTWSRGDVQPLTAVVELSPEHTESWQLPGTSLTAPTVARDALRLSDLRITGATLAAIVRSHGVPVACLDVSHGLLNAETAASDLRSLLRACGSAGFAPRRLDLSHNVMLDTAASLALLDANRHLLSLEVLSVEHTELTPAAALGLVELAFRLPRLRHFGISLRGGSGEPRRGSAAGAAAAVTSSGNAAAFGKSRPAGRSTAVAPKSDVQSAVPPFMRLLEAIRTGDGNVTSLSLAGSALTRSDIRGLMMALGQQAEAHAGASMPSPGLAASPPPAQAAAPPAAARRGHAVSTSASPQRGARRGSTSGSASGTVGDAKGAALAGHAALPRARITALSFSGCQLGAFAVSDIALALRPASVLAGGAAIAGNTAPSTAGAAAKRSSDAGGTTAQTHSLRALAGKLSHLRYLNLSGCGISSVGLAPLTGMTQ
jgi:hypothetical protein